MRVSIFGMGHVGCVTAAALSGRGHDVIGVEVNGHKIRMINRGQSPVPNEQLDEAIRFSVRRGKLRATTDARWAIQESEVSLVCLGTTAKKNGIDYGHLLPAIWEIGEAVKRKEGIHVVAMRSPVPPGTTESLVIPELEKISGKKIWQDFIVCANPALIGEGSSNGFGLAPAVVMGSHEGRGVEQLGRLYEGTGPVLHTTIKAAETLRYLSSAFTLLKGLFASELEMLCRRLEIDPQELMGFFSGDDGLRSSPNLSRAKSVSDVRRDLATLRRLSEDLKISLPLLETVLNDHRLEK